MPLATDINGIVARLEASFIPRLEAFGRSLMQSNEGIVAEASSHRHADCVHSLGLSCRPIGTEPGDPRTVALIVNVIDREELGLRGFVVWQSNHYEGMTAVYDTFEQADFDRFDDEIRELLNTLATAVQRGSPPDEPGHNPPMQRTGRAERSL